MDAQNEFSVEELFISANYITDNCVAYAKRVGFTAYAGNYKDNK